MMFNLARTFVTASSLAVAGFVMAPAEADVITPIATGGAVGSSFINLANAFDSQPASPPTVGDTSDPGGGGTQLFNGRTGYMDFGPNYADITIEATFELLKQYGSAPTYTPLYYWSTDTELGVDDIAAPNFGFNSPHSADGDQQWIARYAGPAVTPSARYLIIDIPDTGTEGNRSLEWVFVGEVVPEPASLALLGLGGLLMLGRSRKA